MSDGIALDDLLTRVATHEPRLVPNVEVAATSGVVIADVTHDSRRVMAGTLFVCVRGSQADGHQFAEDALAAGAVALVVDRRLSLGRNVPQLVVADTREAMGPIAAAFYDFPGDALTLIGITGTNGKTTTAHALESIVAASGRKVAVIGTLTQGRTTPEATDLQRRLAELRSDGVEIVILEVTSHALDLHRVRGLHFDVAIFTNLSPDHLDFHETMEAYFRAKAKLFTPEYATRAIVNSDDPRGSLLVAAALIPTESVTLSDATSLVLGATHSTFEIRGEKVELALAGSFNVSNALEAAGAARMLGIDDSTIARGLTTTSVPGRFEPIVEGQSFGVVIDFAHTPDGLERLLKAARETLAAGSKLICVFGCGGDRDRAKRPAMGAIGSSLSDVAIITSDNPRSEDPKSIADQMLAGVSNRSRVVVELDRAVAIERAIGVATDSDLVVIAGKGHETGQESGGVVLPFDDREVARETLRRLHSVGVR